MLAVSISLPTQDIWQQLAARGVGGVHLVMDAAHTSARAFYGRLGFVELPTDVEGIAVLGIHTS